jgi:hypothetical protein
MCAAGVAALAQVLQLLCTILGKRWLVWEMQHEQDHPWAAARQAAAGLDVGNSLAFLHMKILLLLQLVSAQPQALGEPYVWVKLAPAQSSGKLSSSSLGSAADRPPSR